MNALAVLEEIVNFKSSASEFYSPVGWSKCNACAFFKYCWPKAEKAKDVALVFGVDQGLAIQLHQDGITTPKQLLQNFNEDTLSEFQRPYGRGMRKVGKTAYSIMYMAEALVSGEETVLQKPDIPESSNYAMFDLEGLPPYLNETEKIYLWGMQVFGANPGEFLAATAGFGEDGDKQGWEDFLQKANTIFEEYGDIPFVHWHHYQTTPIQRDGEGLLRMPELMTEAELIEYLRIPEISSARDHKNVIDNLKRMRHLPRIHLCHKPLYPKKAIDQWLAENIRFEG